MTVVIGGDEKPYVQSIEQSRVVAEKGGFFGWLLELAWCLVGLSSILKVHQLEFITFNFIHSFRSNTSFLYVLRALPGEKCEDNFAKKI